MLSVLVWLAMQLPYNSVDCDPQMRNGKEYQQCAIDAPAEHVIEIKTVREYDEECVEQWNLTHCDNTGCAIHGWDDDMKHCARVIRELLIDGVKFGVIKGLE